MAPRESFSSIELAKEAAGSHPVVVKKAGLRGLTKRHWISAAFIYALSVTGASVGSYYLGDNNGFETCAAIINEDLPPTPDFHPVGPVTDVDGTHYAFRDGYVAHSWKGDVAKDPYATSEKYEKYNWEHKFDTPEGYMPGGRTSPTLTKRKRDLPAPTALAGSDSDSDGEVVLVEEVTDDSDSDGEVVVVEEPADSDGEVVVVEEPADSDSDSDSDVPTEVTVEEETAEPDVVEIHDPTAEPDVVEVSDPSAPADVVEVSDPGAPADVVEVSDPSAPADVVEIDDPTAEPDVVEIHDDSAPPDVIEIDDPFAAPDLVIEDSEPEVVVEQSEVESDSDSDFLHLARRSNNDFYPEGPYASGNHPNGFAGNGNRAVEHGVRKRPNIPDYAQHLEIPKSPQAHRAVVDTERGGFRIADPYYAAPTKAYHHVAQAGPAVVTAASQAVVAPAGPSEYVVTITLPYNPHVTHVAEEGAGVPTPHHPHQRRAN